MEDTFNQAIVFFNAQNYFRAHELWEKMWINAGQEKKFLQGLIQIAVGYHHFMHENKEGAVMLIGRGCGYLSEYPGNYLGIDSANFIKEAIETISKINKNEPFGFPRLKWKTG